MVPEYRIWESDPTPENAQIVLLAMRRAGVAKNEEFRHRLRLTPHRNNMNSVFINGRNVLFSYETPVAVYDPDLKRFYETTQAHSRTTNRHIRDFKEGLGWTGDVISVAQEIVNDMARPGPEA